MEAQDEDDERVCRRCSRFVHYCGDRYNLPKDALESHGGALVNLIHGYTDNGDPFIRKFTDELLEEVRNYIMF
jgi:hypothetical protein